MTTEKPTTSGAHHLTPQPMFVQIACTNRMAWGDDKVRVFELTVREAAELDEEMVLAYWRRYEFRLASMSHRVREKMYERMIAEQGIKGGWFYTVDDSDVPTGPFDTADAARAEGLTQRLAIERDVNARR